LETALTMLCAISALEMLMNLMSRLTVAALSLLVVALAGCAAQTMSPGQGQTAAYADGFADGCRSGRAAQFSIADSYRKNASRFESDKDYAQGWAAGFERCEYEQMQKNAQGAN
jgi:hypothetical protein